MRCSPFIWIIRRICGKNLLQHHRVRTAMSTLSFGNINFIGQAKQRLDTDILRHKLFANRLGLGGIIFLAGSEMTPYLFR